MAKKGSIIIYGNIQIPNAYLRLGGVSGGKQSGYWQADIQVFGDGGVAALAYEAAMAAHLASPLDEHGDRTVPPPDSTARDAVRVTVTLPLIDVPYSPDTSPYAALYAAISVLYPSLTDA